MTRKDIGLLAAAFAGVAVLSFGLFLLFWRESPAPEPPAPEEEQEQAEAQVEALPAPGPKPPPRPRVRRRKPEVKDLLVNGSFEEADASGGPSGWKKDRHPGAVTVIEAPGSAGKNCLRLLKGDEVHVRAWQEAECKGGTTYLLSGRARCSGLKGAAYAEVYAHSSDADVEPRVVAKTARFIGDCDWEEFQVPFATEEKDEKLVVYARIQSGSGTAWFDDVRLVERPKEPLGLELRVAYFTRRKRKELRFEVGDPAAAAGGVFRLRVGNEMVVQRTLGHEREFAVDVSEWGWKPVRLVATIEKAGRGVLARLEKTVEIPPGVFPLPRKWRRLDGWFALKGLLPVACVSGEESCEEARGWLVRELGKLRLTVVPAEAVGEPALIMGEFSGPPSEEERSGLGDSEEAYRLVVRPSRVTLLANSCAGLVRGVGTFLQLVEIKDGELRARCCEMTDSPDLRLRMVYCPGTSLDERLKRRARSRHDEGQRRPHRVGGLPGARKSGRPPPREGGL